MFKTAKMPSSGQIGLLQGGGGVHCRDCKQFLTDLILARKAQRWHVNLNTHALRN